MSATKVSTLQEIKNKLTGKSRAKVTSKEAFAFKDKSAFNFDMLYQLSGMSVIAAAGVPRQLIFEYAAKLPCSVAESFKKVELTCERLKYDYAKACSIVGETIKEEKLRELLLRFSSSLLSGEPESEFLIREAKVQSEEYDNEYGRKLETLKLWTDAYVSLILSAVLIIIMGVVSTMIWQVSMAFLIGLVVVSAGTTAIGVWLIYLMSPREKMVLKTPGSKEQKLAQRMLMILLPGAVVIAGFIMVMGISFGWAVLAIAIMVFPIGYIASKDGAKVAKRDSELGTFLASLGGICAAIGTTVREALGRLDLKAMNSLQDQARRLHVRLNSGILPKRCWDKFVEETGSELANRSIGMFYEAVDLGGEAGKVGYHASLFANKISMLRERRKAVANPFRWLCIAMHAAVVGLLVFVSEVITIFGTMVGQAEKAMPNISGAPTISAFTSFNTSGLGLLRTLVIPLVIIFTISNTLAPSIAEGGSWLKTFYNFGIIAAISAICMICLPQIAAMLFSSVKM